MVLDLLLERLKSNDSRVVLFSQFTTTLDIIEELLEYRKSVPS